MDILKFVSELKLLADSHERLKIIEAKWIDDSKKNNELNKELQSCKKELRRLVYKFDKLSKASNVEICKTCDGDGGFQWDDGMGNGGSEMCGECEGSGIVEK